MQLVEDAYRLTANFPTAELYGLMAQVRRSAVSIPSNLAEGVGRVTRGEKRQFFGHARGSLNELRTQMEIASRLALVNEEEWTRFDERADDLSRGIAGLLDWAKR
jgi:four helix bundle protein